MKISLPPVVLAFVFLFGSYTISFSQAPTPYSTPAGTQTTQPKPKDPAASPSPTPVNFIKDVARDQVAIWTSPFHLHAGDLKWLAPMAVVTGGLIASDRATSGWVGRNGSLPGASRWVSRAGSIYITGGVAAGFYLGGRASHDEHAAKTGRLAAEALIDTSIVTQAAKFAFGRERPNQGNSRGLFFKNDRSFPSGHASSVWAVATVVAYQYKDHPWVKYGAFTLAALVSLSRYSGRNHFLSDVFVGSAVGFGIGRYVYTAHH